MSLYEECVALGIPTHNHASDLYIPATEQTRALVKKHDKSATTFVNQVEGGLWLDVAFSYDPWWTARTGGTAQ